MARQRQGRCAGGRRIALLAILLLSACSGSVAPPATGEGTPDTATSLTPADGAPTTTLPSSPPPALTSAPPWSDLSPTPPRGTNASPATGLPAHLIANVNTLILAYATKGLTTAGVVIKDDETGAAIRVNPDEQFPAASLYKLFVLWAVQSAIRAGELDDDTALTLTLETDDSVEDGYSLGEYGDTLTVAAARHLMVTASNNTAAWLLVAALGGWREVERPLRANGFTLTETAPDLLTTPREVTRYFEGLVNQALDPTLTAADYALMLGLLREQVFNDYLSPGLPASVAFAHKTGQLDDALHDAGVLFLPGGRIVYLTVLTSGDYEASLAFMRDLATIVATALAD